MKNIELRKQWTKKGLPGNERIEGATDHARRISYNFMFENTIKTALGEETKITPTDIDGMIERKGFFIFMEYKQAGSIVPMGQRILFESLVKLSDKVLHLSIFHNSEKDCFVPLLDEVEKIVFLHKCGVFVVREEPNKAWSEAIFQWLRLAQNGWDGLGDGCHETFVKIRNQFESKKTGNQ